MPIHTVPATRGRFPAYTHVWEGGALRNRPVVMLPTENALLRNVTHSTAQNMD